MYIYIPKQMHTHMCITYINKTSMQWTPGSQVYLNIKKKISGQK